jgi:alpha-ketoglutarate-dependent taurine dioxygenase
MRLMRTVADDSAYKILRIRPLTGALGAEISGVDLSKPRTAAAREEIKRALYDHLVIYCHDQEGFSRELHLEFAQMFGKLQKSPHIFSVDGYPDVQMVRREPGHASRMEYTCRVRWQPNMVLVWDNRCTYHSASADYAALRYIERVTTGGEVPE